MENFNYQSVPFHYLHCLNPSCARSASCLRHLAAQHVPAEVTHIMAVNPANYPAEADRCAYFRSTEKQRYAWGISSLFDNIPYKKAVYLKRKMHDLYPRTTYYRILIRNAHSRPESRKRSPHCFFRQASTKSPFSTGTPMSTTGTSSTHPKATPLRNLLSG